MDATTGGPADTAREQGAPHEAVRRASRPRNQDIADAVPRRNTAQCQQPAEVQTKKKDLDHSKSFQDFCGGS